jgi:hypothetical protein
LDRERLVACAYAFAQSFAYGRASKPNPLPTQIHREKNKTADNIEHANAPKAALRNASYYEKAMFFASDCTSRGALSQTSYEIGGLVGEEATVTKSRSQLLIFILSNRLVWR